MIRQKPNKPLVVALALFLLLEVGCWNVGDLAQQDAGASGDSDVDTEFVDSDDGDTDTGAAAPYVGITSGIGAIRTESVQGWIVIGGAPSAETLETESHRISVGIGPTLNQQNPGAK